MIFFVLLSPSQTLFRTKFSFHSLSSLTLLMGKIFGGWGDWRENIFLCRYPAFRITLPSPFNCWLLWYKHGGVFIHVSRQAIRSNRRLYLGEIISIIPEWIRLVLWFTVRNAVPHRNPVFASLSTFEMYLGAFRYPMKILKEMNLKIRQ